MPLMPFGLSATQLAAVLALATRGGDLSGVETVLTGDSETDWFELLSTPAGVTYDQTTRLLTFPNQSSHRTPVNGVVAVWGYGYESFSSHRRYPAITIDASTVGCVLDVDHGADLPQGVLSAGTNFIRYETRHSGANGWVNWLQMFTGRKLKIVRNAAQSGNTSVRAATQLQADVLDYKPRLVLGNVLGVNDQSSGNGPLPISETLAALEDMYSRILETRAMLLLRNITPPGATEPRATKAIANRIREINRWVTDFAKGRANMIVIDSHRDVIDPTSDTGSGRAAALRTADQIHLSLAESINQARRCAVVVNNLFPQDGGSDLPTSVTDSYLASCLSNVTLEAANGVITVSGAGAVAHGWREREWLRTRNWTQASANGVFHVLSASANSLTFDTGDATLNGAITGASGRIGNSRQCFPNPLLTTTSGGSLGSGITGVAAAGMLCTTSGTPSGSFAAVASVVARADGFGNDQQIAVSAATLNDRPAFLLPGTSIVVPELLPGRTYVLVAELRLQSANWSATPISEIYANMQVTVDGNAFMTSAVEAYDSTQVGTTIPSGSDDLVLHLRTAPMQMPASFAAPPTKGDILIYARAAGTFTGTMNMRLGRISWRDVTDD